LLLPLSELCLLSLNGQQLLVTVAVEFDRSCLLAGLKYIILFVFSAPIARPDGISESALCAKALSFTCFNHKFVLCVILCSAAKGTYCAQSAGRQCF
jgi:hypothetical protein